MTISNERVISIALPDDVWRAFTQTQPDPVLWLKARIQESIDSARSANPGGSQPLGRA